MRALFDARSEVAADRDGWTWLRPERASLRRHQALAWALLAVALGAGSAGVAFLDPLPGGVLALAGITVAITLIRVATGSAHTRAGVSTIGLLVQTGAMVTQASWPAVRALHADGDGLRRRLVVATDRGPTHRTRATFDAEALADWLERAAGRAREAGRQATALDDGSGFTLG